MRSIDVTGYEISKRKSVENKGFSGVGTVWTTVPAPGFLRLNSLWKLVYCKNWRIVEWTEWILGVLS